MYNLVDNYLKTGGILWQHYKDEPSLNDEGATFGFGDNKNCVSFKLKKKKTEQTGKRGKKLK